MPKVRIHIYKLQMPISPWSFLKKNFKVLSTKKKTSNVSEPFFFHTNIHIVYFKTVRGHVDIQFALWPNVMKKMKFATENWIFCEKCDISKTVKYIDKHRNSFGDYLDQNHSRKQNLKSGITFNNWKQNFLPKALKQYQIGEIWNEKSCDMYFSTVVYKAVKCKF